MSGRRILAPWLGGALLKRYIAGVTISTSSIFRAVNPVGRFASGTIQRGPNRWESRFQPLQRLKTACF